MGPELGTMENKLNSDLNSNLSSLLENVTPSFDASIDTMAAWYDGARHSILLCDRQIADRGFDDPNLHMRCRELTKRSPIKVTMPLPSTGPLLGKIIVAVASSMMRYRTSSSVQSLPCMQTSTFSSVARDAGPKHLSNELVSTRDFCSDDSEIPLKLQYILLGTNPLPPIDITDEPRTGPALGHIL
jgi:hypothetical protein